MNSSNNMVDVEKLADGIEGIVCAESDETSKSVKLRDFLRRSLSDAANRPISKREAIFETARAAISHRIKELEVERDDLRSAVETWKSNARDAHQKLRESKLREKRLAEAIEITLNEDVGSHGRNPMNNGEEFDCEYCRESHADPSQIPHGSECPVTYLRAALSDSQKGGDDV